MKYILKDKREVESLPIGNSSVKIGEKSPDGMLEVLDRGPAPISGRGATVICKCKCGNITLMKLQAFRNGTTKSCGCYNLEVRKKICSDIGKKKNYKDYSKENNIFYTFIEPINKYGKDGSRYWKIKCKKCGKEYEEIPSQIISEKRKRGNNPCSCYKKESKGVLKIKLLLKNNNIDYVQEKTFDSCLSPKGNLLKFDFYLTELNILIEYDGEQHFLPQNFGDKNKTGEKKLETQMEYDLIKTKWCENNNIKLIRISYKDYDKIEEIIGDLNE